MLESAQSFAGSLQNVVTNSLPGSVSIRAVRSDNRVMVTALENLSAGSPHVPSPAPMALYCDGAHLANWTMVALTELTEDGFLRVVHMRMALFAVGEKEPLVRLEYESNNMKAPVTHWQFHGERGSFSFLLARTKEGKRGGDVPMSLSKLHFSAGGRRFRPGLEDFVQFLIQDCGFDSLPLWKRTVEAGRADARRLQVRTVARDHHAEVADVLRGIGWSVSPPDQAEVSDRVERLREY